MYALARHLGSAPLCFSFAWQGRGLLLSKGCDVRSGAAPGLRASVLQFAWQARDLLLSKVRDVRSGAAPGLRASVRQFRVAGARLAALQGP